MPLLFFPFGVFVSRFRQTFRGINQKSIINSRSVFLAVKSTEPKDKSRRANPSSASEQKRKQFYCFNTFFSIIPFTVCILII